MKWSYHTISLPLYHPEGILKQVTCLLSKSKQNWSWQRDGTLSRSWPSAHMMRSWWSSRRSWWEPERVTLRLSLPSPPPTSPSFSATFSSPSQAPYSHHHYHLQNRMVFINLFKHIVQIIFKANYDKNDGRPHHFHNSTTLSSYFYRASSSNHDNRKDGLPGVCTFKCVNDCEMNFSGCQMR